MNKIRIVVPAYNECESLHELIERISKVMSFDSAVDYDICLIDDGSTDDTPSMIRELVKFYPRLSTIRLRKNSGKSLALMAAFRNTFSDYIITIDADLQDAPEDIPLIIDKLELGYDLVCGYRKTRNQSLFRTLGSKCYNFMLKSMFGIEVPDSNSGIKGYSNRLYKSIYIYGQLHRFITVLADCMGFKICHVPVDNFKRKHGSSKYKAFRYESAFDLVSVFFVYRLGYVPLHFYAKLSSLFIIPSTLFLLYFSFSQLMYYFGMGDEYKVFLRPALLLIPFGLITGMQIFLTGILFDYMLNLKHIQLNQRIDLLVE